MKKLIITIALLMIANVAQADQFQVVMDAFDRYNRSLMTGAEYQPIQQVQQPQQYQQPVQQPVQYVQYQVPQQISYPPQQTQQQPVQYVQYQVPQQVQYVPIQQVQYQQPQQYQEQQNFNARDAIQNVASMANDLSYGIQTVKSITNMFKGGY